MHVRTSPELGMVTADHDVRQGSGTREFGRGLILVLRSELRHRGHAYFNLESCKSRLGKPTPSGEVRARTYLEDRHFRTGAGTIASHYCRLR
jgi:hypothetical protein